MLYAHCASWGEERSLKDLLIKRFGGQGDFFISSRFRDEEEEVTNFKMNESAQTSVLMLVDGMRRREGCPMVPHKGKRSAMAKRSVDGGVKCLNVRCNPCIWLWTIRHRGFQNAVYSARVLQATVLRFHLIQQVFKFFIDWGFLRL